MAQNISNPFRIVWFYNSDSGSVISEPALGDTIQSHLPGWHGPFGTKQEALNFYQQNKAAHPDWKAPTGLAGAIGNAATHDAGVAVKLPSWALTATGLSGWFVRGMKVVFGGILIILGISRLTGADNKVVQLASKVPVIPV